MMIRVASLLSAGLVALASGAAAAERSLTTAEITQLLSGNTVIGSSDKGEWRQYFDPAGDTTYARGSDAPSRGAWQVKDGKYCSQWPPQSVWVCYAVTGDLDAHPATLTWIGDSGTRYPGRVQPGNGL